MAPLFKLANDIAVLRRRLAGARNSELEGHLKLGLARMQWSLDGLIDDTQGWIEDMPWWTEWSRRR
jgi:hypothetical protein